MDWAWWGGRRRGGGDGKRLKEMAARHKMLMEENKMLGERGDEMQRRMMAQQQRMMARKRRRTRRPRRGAEPESTGPEEEKSRADREAGGPYAPRDPSTGGRGLLDAFVQITRSEGARGLYRGLGVNLTRVIPSTAVTFVSYEWLNHKLQAL